MNLFGLIVAIFVVLLIVSVIGPASGGPWYPARWGYYPAGGFVTLLIAIVLLRWAGLI